jgi:D-beta-D-heptose 7-phosphate kinase/D-beta-D-heptose 1-phosphate adenosyltransferase
MPSRPVRLTEKIQTRERAAEIVAGLRRQGRRIVFTNGCFDLLHVGHAHYLEQARELGDFLIIGLNSDESVRAVKGENRPIVPENERAQLLAALASVDMVIIYGETRSTPLLDLLRPEIFVKGGDYTRQTMNQEEKNFVESYGGQVVLIPPLPDSSTTAMIERILARHGSGDRGQRTDDRR